MYINKKYLLSSTIMCIVLLSIQACTSLKKTKEIEKFKILKEYKYKKNNEAKSQKIILRKNVLLFSTDELKTDIDGSRYAYGIADQGVEHICNGLSPTEPKRCRNLPQTNKNGCFKHCKKKFKEWYNNGHKLNNINNYMRSIGLGGSNGKNVTLKLQENNKTMFVSHTAVSYNRKESTITEQEAQMESFSIPFFVIPSKFRQEPWDATPGDIGIAVHAQDPARYVFFVIGDVGGNLDEGSVRLQELLKGEKLTPTKTKNIFGKNVKRYGNYTLKNFSDTENLDLRIAIFRGTSSYDSKKTGRTIILQDIKSQKDMLKAIQKIGTKKLKELGGIKEIILYTNKLKNTN